MTYIQILNSQAAKAFRSKDASFLSEIKNENIWTCCNKEKTNVKYVKYEKNDNNLEKKNETDINGSLKEAFHNIVKATALEEKMKNIKTVITEKKKTHKANPIYKMNLDGIIEAIDAFRYKPSTDCTTLLPLMIKEAKEISKNNNNKNLYAISTGNKNGVSSPGYLSRIISKNDDHELIIKDMANKIFGTNSNLDIKYVGSSTNLLMNDLHVNGYIVQICDYESHPTKRIESNIIRKEINDCRMNNNCKINNNCNDNKILRVMFLTEHPVNFMFRITQSTVELSEDETFYSAISIFDLSHVVSILRSWVSNELRNSENEHRKPNIKWTYPFCKWLDKCNYGSGCRYIHIV